MFCLDSTPCEEVLMMPPTLYSYPIHAHAPVAPVASTNTTWFSFPTTGVPHPHGIAHSATLSGNLTATLSPAQFQVQPNMLISEAGNASPLLQMYTPTTPPANYPMSVTLRMEVVWHGEFERFFNRLPNVWCLNPISEDTSPPQDDSWIKFQDSAKVRFCCQDCGRGWTSMKGRVGFWFRVDPTTQQGAVLFKLYGQICQRCSKEETFCHAMWYPEEVVKVIENLYNRVASALYGVPLPLIRYDRRGGKPRAQHDSKLCQACKDGICKEGWTMS